MSKKPDMNDTSETAGVAASDTMAAASAAAVQPCPPGPGSWTYDPATGKYSANDEVTKPASTLDEK